MGKMFCAAILALSISGCALLGTAKPNCEPTRVWQKEGATEQEFYTAKFICIQQSQYNTPETGPGLNWESFNECMKAFGFTPAEGSPPA